MGPVPHAFLRTCATRTPILCHPPNHAESPAVIVTFRCQFPLSEVLKEIKKTCVETVRMVYRAGERYSAGILAGGRDEHPQYKIEVHHFFSWASSLEELSYTSVSTQKRVMTTKSQQCIQWLMENPVWPTGRYAHKENKNWQNKNGIPTVFAPSLRNIVDQNVLLLPISLRPSACTGTIDGLPVTW